MHYTFCNNFGVAESLGDVYEPGVLTKRGQSTDGYPGGEVFLSVEAAEAAMNRVRCFEIPARFTPRFEPSFMAQVYELDGVRDIYWHRTTRRLVQDAVIGEQLPIKRAQFAFVTGVYWHESRRVLFKAMRDLFPDEQDLLSQIGHLEELCKRCRSPRDGYKFMFEGPASDNFMIAKLTLAA